MKHVADTERTRTAERAVRFVKEEHAQRPHPNTEALRRKPRHTGEEEARLREFTRIEREGGA